VRLRHGRALALLAGALWLLGVAHPARATMEEYTTFDVAAEEEDDESALDHLLTRMPREWRDEWERSPQVFRSAQGCLTSGQWLLENQLTLRSPLGTRARFDLGLLQVHTNEQDYEALSFGFRFPVPLGTAVGEFLPVYDKSRQDVTFAWEAGADTAALLVRLQFTVEDAFNNFWAFRQSRMGTAAASYTRHPYEPGLRVAGRGAWGRFDAGARWMTPSNRVRQPDADSPVARRQSLWGSVGWAALEARAAGAVWEARAEQLQALTTDAPVDRPALDRRRYRRRWSAELSVARAVAPRLDARALARYQSRDQRDGAGLGPGAFAALDRIAQLELSWRVHPRLTVRAGGLFDRISIARAGVMTSGIYPSRDESRAYLGLMARFGRLSLQAVEGIELDAEPYDVSGVHDKGFLQLQTTF
jgi:hypothetical protein